MRIGIIGAHGVGKTTLASILSKNLGTDFIPEQIRVAVEKYYALGYKTPDELVGTPWYNNMVLDTILCQIKKESSKNSFISDRTVLDYYIYYSLLSNEDTTILEHFRTYAFQYFRKKYDLIIYIPIMFSLLGDSYRNTDTIFQEQVDCKIKDFLTNDSRVYTIVSKDLNERIHECEELIKRLEGDAIND